MIRYPLLILPLLLAGCAVEHDTRPADTDEPDDTGGLEAGGFGDQGAAGLDPMVGDWAATGIVQDGEHWEVPATDDQGTTTKLLFSFTDEPRGLLTWRYTHAAGHDETETVVVAATWTGPAPSNEWDQSPRFGARRIQPGLAPPKTRAMYVLASVTLEDA